MTREDKLKRLEEQYSAEFSGCNYPEEFVPHGTMTECNFGGMLAILSNSGTACVVWSDWSDTAVSDSLTEYEICYKENEEQELVPGFFVNEGTENETFYSLDDFLML
jgi:hypothetical protein